ncbi:zinc finger HIT domain-containing protein 3-like [Rhopilema esculentum]|uniref:zinc finger HIT domain-containing protein 3-like n=1 Tax=Rhopilema esculentum TaxID=499914 RepID=UPI0031CE2308
MKGKCEICCSADSRYRCPSCKILYCSLGCYKNHKATQCGNNHNEPEDNNEETTSNESAIAERLVNTSKSKKDLVQDDNEDMVPPEKLLLLGNSKELLDELRNEHLRNMLLSIDASANPGQQLEQAMQIPLFAEFADVCLKALKGNNEL